jgi:RNA polymerase sigma-70 factor (ECF subfamily)
MELDAEGLVKATCGGDEAAAGRLVELFYERIYAFLRRLAGNDEDAADLTQRTFSEVWEALPGFAGRSSVASWMHSIAYHIYADWRRADSHAELRLDEWWAEHPGRDAGPDEQATASDMAAVLYGAVDRLEADLRETVHLHYYQELTLAETAEAMGVATSTVKYRLRQALAQLQKRLADKQTLPR